MPHKRVLHPDRVRQIPTQFSWLDQRLVRERHIERCDVQALALYRVLVTVADAQGLSDYGEARLERLLSMPAARLRQARADLIHSGLIAYERPLYQVLSLDLPPAARLRQARADLIHSGLIAYERPLYQVLSLDLPPVPLAPGVQSIARTLARLQATLAGKRGAEQDPTR